MDRLLHDIPIIFAIICLPDTNQVMIYTYIPGVRYWLFLRSVRDDCRGRFKKKTWSLLDTLRPRTPSRRKMLLGENRSSVSISGARGSFSNQLRGGANPQTIERAVGFNHAFVSYASCSLVADAEIAPNRYLHILSRQSYWSSPRHCWANRWITGMLRARV